MDTLERIKNYLGNGGLFNPEMMEHEKVRDLIMACRDEIALLRAANLDVRRIALERDDADQYICSIWKANLLPSPMSPRLFDRLTGANRKASHEHQSN